MSNQNVQPLLIFDFDGTLANTIDTGIAIYNDIAPEYNLKQFGSDDVRELRKLNIRAVLKRMGISKLTAIRLAARIRKEIHSRMDEIDMIPGADQAIRSLHESGFRMGIVSSNSTENIRDFINRFNLDNCFEFIEAGVSLFGKSKRLKQVIKKQEINASQVLYVGDETRDMEAARKTNIGAIGVCWGANERAAMEAEDPDFCIEDPAELAACVDTYFKIKSGK